MKNTKPKACKQCGNLFKQTYSTLQVTCSIKCTLLFNDKKEVDKRVKSMKNEVYGLSILEETARKIFQKWIRARDYNDNCISCDRVVAKWDGGHYLKAELFTGLIFDERNCHKQCAQCNGDNMHGNPIGYRRGLVKKIGIEQLEQLEDIADSKRVYKFTRSELIDIANKYKLKLKTEYGHLDTNKSS